MIGSVNGPDPAPFLFDPEPRRGRCQRLLKGFSSKQILNTTNAISAPKTCQF